MEENKILRELIKAVFKKAGEESKKESKTGQAKHLAQTVFLEGPGYKTYVRYFDQYLLDNQTDVGKPDIDRLNQLAVFCGYKNFADFSQNFERDLKEKEESLVQGDDLGNEELSDPIIEKEAEFNEIKKANKPQNVIDTQNEKNVEDKTDEIVERKEKNDFSHKETKQRINKEDKKAQENKVKKNRPLKNEENDSNNEKAVSKKQKKVNRPYKIPQKESIKKLDLTNTKKKNEKEKKKRKGIILFLVVLLVGFLLFIIYDRFANTGLKEKEVYACVEWFDGHYREVECGRDGAISVESEKEYNEFMDKEEVTVYIDMILLGGYPDEPSIWYCKCGGSNHYFNFSGKHPVTGEILRPVTEEVLREVFKEELALYHGDSASYDEGFTDDEMRPCETNNTGVIHVTNNSSRSVNVELDGPNGLEGKRIIESNEMKSFNDRATGNYIIRYYSANSANYLKAETIDLQTCIEKSVRFDYLYDEDPRDVGVAACWTNESAATFQVVNQSNSGLYFTYSGRSIKINTTLYIEGQSEKIIENIPAMVYDYSVRLKDETTTFETGQFKLSVCEIQQLKLNTPVKETREEVIVYKRPCEDDVTGTVYFKNNGADVARLRISSNGNKRFEMQEHLIQAKEKKYLYGLPTQTYQYSIYSNATNTLIEKSEVNIVQCKEVSRSFQGANESAGITNGGGGGNTSSDCATKGTGDYCFKNNSTKTIHIVLSDYSPTSPLSREFDQMDVEPGNEACYYGKLEGVYNARYNYIDKPMIFKNVKVKVVACKTGASTLQ